MKIKYLWLLNILDEMRSENLNHTIDKEFYDWTDYKSIDWLYENAETIVADFYNNIDKYKFEIKNKKDYFPITSRYLEFSDFKYDRRWMEEAIEYINENWGHWCSNHYLEDIKRFKVDVLEPDYLNILEILDKGSEKE